jgi:CBS domain-containing protein
MHIQDVVDFLSFTPPFDDLPPADRAQLASQVSMRYLKHGQRLEHQHLILIRTGVFSHRDLFNHDQLLSHGDYHGVSNLLSDVFDADTCIHCEEDGLVLELSAHDFHQLRQQYKNFDLFFIRLQQRHLYHHHANTEHHWLMRVADLPLRPPITIHTTASIMAAAQQMTRAQVSAMMVVADEPTDVTTTSTTTNAHPLAPQPPSGQRLQGIVTDRDLRRRVLAAGLDPSNAVAEIMTRHPWCVTPDTLLLDAMQLMSQHNVHHLPVSQGSELLGMITTTDLIRSQQDHPLFLVSHIHRQADMAGLHDCAQRLHHVCLQLAREHTQVHVVQPLLTSLFDALAQRYLQLAEQQLGPAPCLYSFISFGSQARRDMLPSADQDNALLLEKQPDAQMSDYFAKLSSLVCQGLAQSGQVLCQGNIMATNPALRRCLKGWLDRFSQAIETPTPQALLDSSIFFDCRCIAGSQGLFNAMQQDVLQRCQHNELFLYHLAGAATATIPPLGFFKDFILERDGKQKRGLDIKKRGLSLINDLVRVYSLAHGISEVNTLARIQTLAQRHAISQSHADDLTAAWSSLAELRWQLQAQSLLNQQTVSNLLDPRQLSLMQRHQLKDAFLLISSQQKLLRQRFCREL